MQKLHKQQNQQTVRPAVKRFWLEYGRGGWTRTNECRNQNPVPYQLGDAPEVDLQTELRMNRRTVQTVNHLTRTRCIFNHFLAD